MQIEKYLMVLSTKMARYGNLPYFMTRIESLTRFASYFGYLDISTFPLICECFYLQGYEIGGQNLLIRYPNNPPPGSTVHQVVPEKNNSTSQNNKKRFVVYL